MQRSTRLMALGIPKRASPTCPQCRASLRLVPRKPIQKRCKSTTSPSLSAESLKPGTHYEIFPDSAPSGPPPQGPFTIDLKALRREFMQQQAKAHPDRHPQEHKGRAEALSARINDAYKVLQDPLLRAQYILSLKGIDVAEDETAKVDDQELLLEVLESQERIEEAEAEGQLLALTEENNERLENSVQVIDEAFTKDDIETARKEAVRLRYWVNIREGIRNWEPGKEVRLIH